MSAPSPPVRVLLFVGGSLSLAFGALGALLPLLPTAPFVLLAAGCYARAWPPAHQWLRRSRVFGPICRSGAEGRYLPPRAKGVAVLVTLLSFGATIVLVAGTWWLRSVVAALGLAVLVWLVRMPTEPRSSTEPGNFPPDS